MVNSLQFDNAMLQDLLTNQIHKICRYDKICRCLINNLIGRPITEKDIIQTAYVIASTQWEMEKELEMMEQRIWQGDVHMSTLARYIGLITTSEVEIFREIEKMEQNVLISTLDIYLGLMADTQEPKPEIDQQLKLVVEYRHMVRNINMKHIKQQIKEELQINNVQQHKARQN